MNRQIKFRGLRTDGNGWVYGDYFNTSKSSVCKFLPTIIENGGMNPIDFHLVQPTSIGQFTGLTDKNGTEIYEGDYISCLNSGKIDGVILWCSSEHMFKIKWMSDTYMHVRGQSKYYTANGEKLFHNANLVWTVIGNVNQESEVTNV